MAQMTLPRHEQRQQTRAKLIDAALRVFGEHGYDHASVDEIALAAGYSKGAYYFYFDSKQDIFLELVSTWIDEQTRRLRAFEHARGPVTITLVETLESFIRYDDREPHWRLLLPEIWAQSHRNQNVQKALQTAYSRWIDLLQGVFEAASREGLVSMAVRPDVAASLILAAHDGFTLRSRLKSPSERELRASEVVSSLVSLIAPPEKTSVIAPTAKRTVRRTI